MRSCLLALVALVAVVLLVLWFTLPLIVGGLATATLGAVGFNGTNTRVEVFADPPLRLLALDADRVHIRSTSVTVRNIAAGSVDLTLRDVSIGRRQFGVIEGTLNGVTVTPPDGPPIHASVVQLSGPADAARVTLTLDRAAVQALVKPALSTTLGAGIGDLTLVAPDRLVVATPVGPRSGRVAINNVGDVVFITGSGQSIPLMGSGIGAAVRLQSVQVVGDGLELAGTIDLRQ